MKQINSKSYWDERFLSKDWEKYNGRVQSLFFAKVAYSAMPQFLKRDLARNSWVVTDIGCAQGDGTAYLAKQFPSCRFIGFDFSDEAIKLASETFYNCEFSVSDIYSEILPADVIFSSNTLEHLRFPDSLMKKMCGAASKYVIHLLPFEDHYNIDEHINTFSFDAFPIHMGSFYLEYYTVLNCGEIENTCWLGKQILLVYTNHNYRPEQTTLLDVYQNYGVGHYEQCVASLREELFQKDSEISAMKQAISDMTLKSEAEQQVGKAATERIQTLEAELQTNKETAMVLQNELQRQKQSFIERITTLERELQETINKKEEVIKLLESRLSESSNENAMQVAALENELQETKDKVEELIKQLEQEKQKYENLYAYSGNRDLELLKIKNSKSYQVYTKWFMRPMRYFYVLGKALLALDFATFGKELFRPVRSLYLKIKGKLQEKKRMAQIRTSLKNKRVIVFPPSIDWHMPLFQRPQQLAGSYSKKENTAVIYVTKAAQYDNVAFAEQINPNLWLINERYLEQIPELLKEASEVILSIHWTLFKHYKDIIKPHKVIYEYIDELEIFYGYGPEMEKDHLTFMKESDVTVCTATKLYNQAAGLATNPILSPNAGDYEFFSKTDSYEINPLIKDVVASYKCVLGYYGALASWFDYDLIKKVASMHPDWLFVLVGVDYDGTIKKNGIEEIENIVYIPPQPYTELPSFLKAFDIATIPFIINEITLSTSPVKLFEYMAAGKPILASKMPECLKYESVKTYADVDEFCSFVENYIAMKSDDP